MSGMLESYDLSFKGKNGGKKDYKLKFKVAKGVKVTFNQVGDVNQINLNYDSSASGNEHSKNYNVTGPLNVQFFQYPAAGAGKDAPPPPVPPEPEIIIKP